MKPARPGFLLASARIAAKDLRIEWRSFEALSAMVLFSLIVLVIFNFVFDLVTLRELGREKLVPGILWVTVSFAAIVGFARSFALERRRETLTALKLAPVDRGAIFVGKGLANLTLVVALELVVVPLAVVFFDVPVEHVPPLLLLLLLHTVGLAELGTLFSAIAAKVGRGEALLATLLFPFSTPILIAAVKTTGAVLGGEAIETVSGWLLVAAGFDVLYFFVGLLTFEFVLED